MRVIHGVWAHGLPNHGALCLWAEDPDLPPRSGTEAAAPSGMHLPRPHPFRQAAIVDPGKCAAERCRGLDRAEAEE